MLTRPTREQREIHFQPMLPNEYYHWEFKYPRVTQRSTAGLPLSSSQHDGLRHPWRSEFRSFGGQKAPPLVPRYTAVNYRYAP